MKKLPAIPFYPGDWRKDPGIQALDYESRGIWFEILLFMWESERRGLLLLNGKKPDDEILARMLGIEMRNLCEVVAKLVNVGVASIHEETGALMNRRMFNLHGLRSEAGKIGAMNRWQKHSKHEIAKHSPSISFSISSSISSNKKIKDLTPQDFLETIKKNPVYKNIDIDKELGKMDAWLLANKGRKKTKGFVVNWLNKAVDRETVVVPKPAPKLKECFVCGKGKQILESEWGAHWAAHLEERTKTTTTPATNLVKDLAEKLGDPNGNKR